MPYVDGFVVPVAKKNLPAYKRLARKTAASSSSPAKRWSYPGWCSSRGPIATPSAWSMAGSSFWSTPSACAYSQAGTR